MLVCKIYVLPRSVRPNALRVHDNFAHNRVYQITHPRVLGRVFPKGDDVFHDFIETENVTTLTDTVLGSDVWDGLIFTPQEGARWVLVGAFLDVF